MAKAEFSAAITLVTHDPSEIIVIYFAAQEPPVIIHVEISCAA